VNVDDFDDTNTTEGDAEEEDSTTRPVGLPGDAPPSENGAELVDPPDPSILDQYEPPEEPDDAEPIPAPDEELVLESEQVRRAVTADVLDALERGESVAVITVLASADSDVPTGARTVVRARCALVPAPETDP
jgi:hypothetical protein